MPNDKPLGTSPQPAGSIIPPGAAAERLMPSWYYKIGAKSLNAVRKMSRNVAREWLKLNHSDLSTDEMGAILQLCPESPAAKGQTRYDPHQKLFIMAAWLCGASMPQLAAKFGVTRQTILDKMDRTMGKDERWASRLHHSVTDERLEGLRVNYYKLVHSSPDVFKGMTPLEVAIALDAMPVVTVDDEPESAYDQLLDAPERRMASGE